MSNKSKKGAADAAAPSQKKTAAKSEAAKKSKSKADPQAIMDKMKVKELFENDRGEFFTNKNYAMLSVGNNKEKLTIHYSGKKVKAEPETDPEAELETDPSAETEK